MANPSDKLYTVIDRKNVCQRVADQLTELVLTRQLRPGDRLLPERELAERFGVGRNAVREAVKTLQERGLLVAVQGAGTFVQRVSPESVSDSLSLYLQTSNLRFIQLMELREILEVEVVERLATSIMPEDLEALRRSIHRMENLLDDVPEFTKEDVAFHLQLYRSTRNEIILLVMQPVLQLLAEAVAASFEQPGSMDHSLRSHREMVERIAAGDAKGARRASSEMIARAKTRLGSEG